MDGIVTATKVASAPGRFVSGTQVWDRLWTHRPSDEKDARLLDRELRSPRWSLVVDRLEKTFGSIAGLRTIELGCGRGDLSALLARKGARVTLFDRSTSALREARRRFARLELPAAYHHGDMLGALDGHHARYDVALSLGVVEHFRGRERTHVIGAHHRVLRPGGMAIISVPHAWCLPYRVWKSYLEIRGWWPYGMEQPYTKAEMTRRARKAGFGRVETHALGFWQSVGDQWIKQLTARRPDWVDWRSRLDDAMGLVLLMFAWRADNDPHRCVRNDEGRRS